MNYVSTRNPNLQMSSAQAIVQGISAEGGLFVPESFPALSISRLQQLSQLDYLARAKEILSGFLTDFSEDQLEACVQGAYGAGKFDDATIAPLSRLSSDLYLLELWHGPTCAFKDMALQLLPRLMTTSAAKIGEQRTIAILVATSGDTGKAALEGFKDVPGTKMVVFYPQDGVSHMQKLQMTTQEGENVQVYGIEGNFDDAQSGVKAIFADSQIAKTLHDRDVVLSSANSINWGRLVPQIVYYISAYCDLAAEGEIQLGDLVNVTVPTGNFGNILAAYYAKRMGLPIDKLICASNQNNVLTDFLSSGVYDRNRKFFTTTSPSMDILISSNLERLLYELCGRDSAKVSGWMSELAAKGCYALPEELLNVLKKEFWGGFCDDAMAAATIKETFDKYSYLLDTHTAVAVAVHSAYVKATGDDRKTILASTANPYKFPESVLDALEPGFAGSELEKAARLEELTGVAMPGPLQGLSEKPVRFSRTCTVSEMPEAALETL